MKHSYLTFAVWAIFGLLAIASCTNNKRDIRRTLKAFESVPIEIKDTMLCCEGGRLSLKPTPKGLRYIVFYANEDCAECTVGHLDLNIGLFTMGDSFGFNTMIILSPKDEDVHETLDIIRKTKFDFPVWLDLDKFFFLSNIAIPEDSRFHNFLIDDAGYPIFVGYPSDDNMKKLMIQAINNNYLHLKNTAK